MILHGSRPGRPCRISFHDVHGDPRHPESVTGRQVVVRFHGPALAFVWSDHVDHEVPVESYTQADLLRWEDLARASLARITAPAPRAPEKD